MTSTTVRLIRATASATSALSPELGAGLLHRFFTTPRPRKTPERERAWMADSTPDRLQLEDGRALQLWRWGDRGPAVLLVHGWGGAASQLAGFAAPLVALGFRVVAFDQPAHGGSEGKQSAVPDFATAVFEVARAEGPFAGTIAHSLGGSAALLAKDWGAALGRVAAIAPAENLPRYLAKTAELLGFPEAVVGRAMTRLEHRWGVTVDQARAGNFADRLSGPGLVVHDADDREVAPSEGRRIAAAWPGATFLQTEGLGHQRILRDPGVMNAVLSFVSRRAVTLAA